MKSFQKKLSFLALILALLIAGNGFAAAKPPVQGTVNINTASQQDLMKLPGIGKAKAEAIVTYRQAHPFKSVEELSEVKGVGSKMLEKLRPNIAVDAVALAPSAAAQSK